MDSPACPARRRRPAFRPSLMPHTLVGKTSEKETGGGLWPLSSRTRPSRTRRRGLRRSRGRRRRRRRTAGTDRAATGRAGAAGPGGAPAAGFPPGSKPCCYIAMTLVLTSLLKTFFVGMYSIPSESMEPYTYKGDRVDGRQAVHVGRRRAGARAGHRLPRPAPLAGRLGDTGTGGNPLGTLLSTVGMLPEQHDDLLIKRIIGVGGDTVECRTKAGPVYLNGKPLDESGYIQGGKGGYPCWNGVYKVVVPKDSLWVLGDNRQHSGDSAWNYVNRGLDNGFVPRANVVGHVIGVVSWLAGRPGAAADHPAAGHGHADRPGHHRRAGLSTLRVASAPHVSPRGRARGGRCAFAAEASSRRHRPVATRWWPSGNTVSYSPDDTGVSRDRSQPPSLPPPDRRDGRRLDAVHLDRAGRGDRGPPPDRDDPRRRAHRGPDAGEPQLRPLLRHAARRARLRRPAPGVAAERQVGLAPGGRRRERVPAVPPGRRRARACSSSTGWTTAGRAAHQAWNQGRYDQWIPAKGPGTMGHFTRERHPVPLRAGRRVHRLRRLPLLADDLDRPEPVLHVDRLHGQRRLRRRPGPEQRRGRLRLEDLSRAPGGRRDLLEDLPGRRHRPGRRRLLGLDRRRLHRQLRRQLAAVLPPVPERQARRPAVRQGPHRHQRGLGPELLRPPGRRREVRRAAAGLLDRRAGGVLASTRTGRSTTGPGTSPRCWTP